MVRLIPGGLGPEGSRPPEQVVDVRWDSGFLGGLHSNSDEQGPGSFSHPSVASLNLSPIPGDVEANLLMAEEAITEAMQSHPSLRWIVLPEMFTVGYTGLDSVHRHAEDAEHGMSVWRFSALAHSLGVYIAYGFPELLLGGGVANSANLVGPDHPGALLTYRKRHLVQTTDEAGLFVPGNMLPIADVEGLRVALAICWDLGYPEVVREAALAGAEIILAPAAWRDPWKAQYDLSCGARALDNGVYVVSANQQGAYPEAHFSAGGGVFGPDGVRVSGSEGPLSIGAIDFGFLRDWRARYGSTLGSLADNFFFAEELEEIS